MTDCSERMREKQAIREVAIAQAQALAKEGLPLMTPLRPVYRVRPGGERTLHTVVASWSHDAWQETQMAWGQRHRDWYRRPTIGDVLLGGVVL